MSIVNSKRIEQLGDDLRAHVFAVLDAEPELTGDGAGEVAAAVEHAFQCAVDDLEDDYEVEYTIECLPEETPIRGNCMVSSDAKFDEECAQKIESDLEYNPWAWCTVKVTASCGGYYGVDHLGCCNYASEEQFCQTGGYYDGMKKESLTSLMATLVSAAIHGSVARRIVAALARD